MFTWETDPNIHRRARGATTVPIRRPGQTQAAATAAAVAPKEHSAVEIARMREPTTREQRLLPLTHAWVTAFAPQLRPFELCMQYPRVANRLALCWPDATLARQVLQSLLVDKRGGRRGFPAEVQVELVALRHASEQAALQAARDRATPEARRRRTGVRDERGARTRN